MRDHDTNARRLIALLGVVLAALFAVGVSASIRNSVWRERPGTATGMMSGYSVPGDGRQVDSLVTARQRAQLMADRFGVVPHMAWLFRQVE